MLCSSTLSFVSILEFVLHSISSYFKSYDHCSIIEMIFNKLHIEVFLIDLRQIIVKQFAYEKLHEYWKMNYLYKDVYTTLYFSMNDLNALNRMLTVKIRVKDRLIYQ